MEEGWLGKPKGLLHVLWERRWINESSFCEYSLKGTRNEKDKEGVVEPQHQRFVFHSLMMQCADFKEEKLAMEVLLDRLSAESSNNQSIKLLLAGEGIKYVWGMAKHFYRSCALDKEIQNRSLTKWLEMRPIMLDRKMLKKL